MLVQFLQIGTGNRPGVPKMEQGTVPGFHFCGYGNFVLYAMMCGQYHFVRFPQNKGKIGGGAGLW